MGKWFFKISFLNLFHQQKANNDDDECISWVLTNEIIHTNEKRLTKIKTWSHMCAIWSRAHFKGEHHSKNGLRVRRPFKKMIHTQTVSTWKQKSVERNGYALDRVRNTEPNTCIKDVFMKKLMDKNETEHTTTCGLWRTTANEKHDVYTDKIRARWEREENIYRDLIEWNQVRGVCIWINIGTAEKDWEADWVFNQVKVWFSFARLIKMRHLWQRVCMYVCMCNTHCVSVCCFGIYLYNTGR